MNKKKIAIITSAVIILALCLFFGWKATHKHDNVDITVIPYSELRTLTHLHKITEVNIARSEGIQTVIGKLPNGDLFRSDAPAEIDLADALREDGVKVTVPVRDPKVVGNADNLWSSFMKAIIPALIFGVVQIIVFVIGGRLMMRGLRGRKKYKSLVDNNTKLSDVVGIDTIKQEVVEIIEIMTEKNNGGVKRPGGVLFLGPPGVGKTMIAKAIATEADVPFFSVSGSEFVEVYVGMGAARVRALKKEIAKFTKNKKQAIVFIDEVDAIAKTRSNGSINFNEERENTLNELLQTMDGFDSIDNILWIAATNRAELLDPAFLRRMDKKIQFTLPDLPARIELVRLYAKKTKKCRVNDRFISDIAKGLPGFSGDDIKNLFEEAGRIARRKKHRFITEHDVEAAKDRHIMGMERKNIMAHMTQEEIDLTAWHECGHALVSTVLPECDPVHKITMIPHGQALGMVVSIPDRERYSWSIKRIKSHIAKAMAGRAAEIIVAGENGITSGASADIQDASRVARSMVSEWGMSPEYGILAPRNDGHNENQNAAIDEIARRYVEEGLKTALSKIREHKDAFEALFHRLKEKETLSGEEVRGIILNNPPYSIVENAIKED